MRSRRVSDPRDRLRLGGVARTCLVGHRRTARRPVHPWDLASDRVPYLRVVGLGLVARAADRHDRVSYECVQRDRRRYRRRVRVRRRTATRRATSGRLAGSPLARVRAHDLGARDPRRGARLRARILEQSQSMRSFDGSRADPTPGMRVPSRFMGSRSRHIRMPFGFFRDSCSRRSSQSAGPRGG